MTRAELGTALLTFAPVRTAEFVELGRVAEGQGYAACYTTETLTDTLAMGWAAATRRGRPRP
jgi:5,10-methylenetetrahydromethanopterin reductase